jgi:hypothetical protein
MSEIRTDTINNASGDNDSGIDLSTNDQVKIKTANTTAVTVDASQNVGIGTSSPDRILHLNNSGTEQNVRAKFTNGTTGEGASDGFEIGINASNPAEAVLVNYEASPMAFFTSGSERMRIDSSGNLLINNTGASPLNSGRVRIYNNTAQDALKTYQATSGTTALWSRIDHTASYFAVFNYNGSTVGTITTNGSATAYNTSSDHRLKENVTADWDATTRLKQLNPVRFNFIADADTTVDGFLAHEVQSVVPEAISGTHNEVEVWKDGEELPDGVSVGDNKLDEDGNTMPVYQGIDQSKLVPLLVKTIQELEARITALENAE